jgi:hypothetical protein
MRLRRLRLYLRGEVRVSEWSGLRKEEREKIDKLGPKLSDCPALVLPCTTARYTTTYEFVSRILSLKYEGTHLTVIEWGVFMTRKELPTIPGRS